MPRPITLLAILLVGIVAGRAAAQDEVFTRRQEKPFKGNIKQETPKGIVIAGVKDMILTEEILEIFYDVDSLTLNASTYRPAFTQEKDLDSKDPKKIEKRKELFPDTIKKYEDAGKGTKRLLAQRHCEYKVAYLRARQAREEGTAPELAILKLTAFAAKHKDGWQTPRALQLLAGLQLEQKDYDGAEESFKSLAALDVPEELKQDAELQAATVFLRMDKKEAGAAKKYLDAQKKVQSLAAGQTKDSKFALRLKIAAAECQGRAGQVKEATALLRGMLKDTADKALKGAAYNALGVTLYDAGQPKEARWEFLWVDVVYNQDKTEHAKALFYLAKIFDELNEPERAQECRNLLLDSRDFQGLEYQRLAQRLASGTKAP